MSAGDAPLPVPEAVVLDLDGVLADVAGRRPLAAVADLEAIAARLPVAVVTSCPRRLAESVLERHGYRPFVCALVAGEDGPGKPSPAPVLRALELLGRAGRPAWMLGDNPGDMQAAQAAGVVALAVAPQGADAPGRAARLNAAGAARLVAGLASLPALLAAGR